MKSVFTKNEINNKGDGFLKEINEGLSFVDCFYPGLLSLLFLTLTMGSYAQTQYQLEVIVVDQEASFLKKNTEARLEQYDSLSIFRHLRQILIELHGKAYLEASFDQITLEDSLYTAKLFAGKTYEWATLQNGNIEKVFLDRVGFRERLYSGRPFNYKEVRRIQEALLDYAENNGYPFASIRLDSIRINNNRIEARLFMNKNRLITFDGVKIEGEVKISESYLKNFLGLKDGSLYSHAKILKIRDRIRELPFLEESRNATLRFVGNKVAVNLYLKKKPSSRWDLLIGLLPPGNNRENAKLRFTGSATLDFLNQLGFGERLFIDFQRLSPGTQEVELQVSYPYVLNLPFGIDFQFEQYRRDTSYNDVKFDLGIQYLFAGGNYLKAFWNNHSSSLLEIDQQNLLNTRSLPENLDITRATFGLEYFLERLDYRFNPRKGWSTTLRGGAGFKTIEPNNSIQSISDPEDPFFKFNSLYDSIELRTFQFNLMGNIEAYLPLFKRSTVKLAARSGWLISEEPVYKNEQFRIGGNRLLRGFDEQSVFATRYAVFTAEYRLLIAENSFLYLFGDYGYTENITAVLRSFERRLGFGVGMSFYASKVGLIGLSLAWPKQFGLEDPVRFNDARVHLGYKSFF